MQDASFEWDDDKAESNERDHDGVSFWEAGAVFLDPNRIEYFDEDHSEEEGRYTTIGFSSKGRLLFVVFAPHPPRLRIISARIAETDEEKDYERNS